MTGLRTRHHLVGKVCFALFAVAFWAGTVAGLLAGIDLIRDAAVESPVVARVTHVSADSSDEADRTVSYTYSSSRAACTGETDGSDLPHAEEGGVVRLYAPAWAPCLSFTRTSMFSVGLMAVWTFGCWTAAGLLAVLRSFARR